MAERTMLDNDIHLERRADGTRVLHASQEIPLPRSEVFPFFADARNLAVITPPAMRFRIRTPEPIAMRDGTLIDYTVRVAGLPIRWQTLISRWEPPNEFADEQVRGPYALWHHRHRFIAVNEHRTRMEDEVSYRLPFGRLGNLAAPFVRHQLRKIFRYRRTAIERTFAPLIMRVPSLLLCAVLAVAAGCASLPAPANPVPADGRAVLTQMHDRYAGKWYNTLTFVQRTTRYRPDGTTQVSTWYEAQKGPRLRIDMGDPAQGNGALYTADSVYVMRAGKVARAMADGNPFLPLIFGVYAQPLDVTVAQLAPYKVNLSSTYTRDWEGQRTFVVGASSPADTTSPQFWVDANRLIVTRFLLPLFPTPDNHVQDARLEHNVPVGGGWLATRVRMLDRGAPVQTEEYSDWRADVPLADSFFQAEHWSEGPHWAVPTTP